MLRENIRGICHRPCIYNDEGRCDMWDESDEKIGIIISYVGFITGLLLIIGYINSKPRAIDVYKGKTELRITYEGNTPVDSAVVFKK